MTKELFVSSSPHETKIAVLEDNELVEVYFERDSDVGLVGGIYKGRVRRVLPGMQSAFVDIGLDRDAFLYVSDFFEDSEEYDKLVSEAEAKVARYTESAVGVEPSTQVPAPSGAVEPALQTLAPPVVEAASKPAPPADAAATETPSRVPAPSEAEPVAASAPVPEMATPVAPPAGQAAGPAPGAPSGSAGPAHQPPHPEKEFQPRGRRRRRGRRGFGEHKFGGKPEFRERGPLPPAREEPHGFELLPGESLAKYSHATSETPTEEPAAATAADATESDRTRQAEVEQPTLTATGPAVAGTAAVEVPRLEPSQSEDETAAPSAEAIGAALTERQYAASETQTTAEPAVAEDPATAEPIETSPTDLRAEEEFVIEHEPVPFTEAITADFKLGRTEVEVEEGAEAEAEDGATEEGGEPAEEAAGEELPSDDADALAAETEHQGETAPEGTEPGGESRESAPAPGAGTESSERSYTLREPHQRPHYAPRRGRRGRRDTSRPRFPKGPEAARASRSGNDQPVQISQLLKEGQEILVQIAKEPLGTKGARITSHIALPGRYLVYMPTISHIGVSRKISSEEERLRLRNIILENRGPLTGGFIVRTAGAGRSEDEFKADLRFLSTLWNEIRAKAERSKAPLLLHRDLDLVQRILRDILSPNFKCVRVDNEADYERVLDFVSRSQPQILGQVKLYDGETPLFEQFGIQSEIDKALKPKVWLKSGGFIVINQTEALVAIDVNTGKYVGKTNRLEDTIVKTNIDAVKEIVRQIRLRDLGGIIVIDFIDMDERRNRQKVVQALEEALRFDRAPTNILSINEFGLVALTRKRVKHSLERTLSEPCPYCSGSGWVKSVATICNEIFTEMKKMANHLEGKVINLRVNPDVAKALKSHDSHLIQELEALVRRDVIMRSDPAVHQERFEIF